MGVLRYGLVILASYLLGSFPTGYLAARLWRGVDPTQHGSGRTGGTNVLRAAGKGPALLTVVGDLAKGTLAVLLARVCIGTEPAMAVAGLAAVLGHNHSVFLGFRGGAGAMTNVGVVLVLAPYVVPVVAVAAFVAAVRTHTASLTSIASVVATVVAFVASFLFWHIPVVYVVYSVLACAMILFDLRANIARLRAGSERRVDSY